MTWTALKIKSLKGKQKITVVTAYDALSGAYADEAEIPLVLVGDSLANTVLGYETTLPVTMDEMIHHTAAVSRGVQNALVVGDMPFMSYQGMIGTAVENAGRFLKEAGADAVKIEGGSIRAELIETLVANGIPVLGHIGLTPQSVKEFGGFKKQGKTDEAARKLMDDAMVLEQAGAFALVLECVPDELAQKISAALKIPTIGIGAGPHCDGQVLVFTDLLGLGRGHVPGFVKKYADLKPQIQQALAAYKADVEGGNFP
ncbi:3-methyl-2-oxobutanoate hydroxymethyltransferase [Tichowtungia aerotolerans]|uniref:3-methyl-2-oxobutanoate hydroxymethyltransferase n=1 Tax=Tichowtungia aerotolerans TaxID=2697043 RepID=A0A6P1M7W9_9BACT|nr:3-methyl-2-oxobutanoate hydroxymethyltransferase [Tichowtungia aerotolerans]QHI69971.1 3-methyl-2-oxobutanoate hydroxymethyltransferase [Tichowtungia aerotolerans]